MGETADRQSDVGFSMPKVVSTGKDAVALLRDATLFLLAVLLLGLPETFNDVLVRAGFEEGSFAGLKWKAKVSQQDEELVAANSTIADLKTQNDSLEKALREAKAQLSDTGLKTRIGKIQEVNAQVLPSASRVQASLQTTISENTELVQKLQGFTDAAVTWAVVFGGDSEVGPARYETGTAAPNIGIRNAVIYYRQGSYRSVVIAADRSEANQLLRRLKARRADAYIVNMSTWCPQPSEKSGYVECKGPN